MIFARDGCSCRNMRRAPANEECRCTTSGLKFSIALSDARVNSTRGRNRLELDDVINSCSGAMRGN